MGLEGSYPDWKGANYKIAGYTKAVVQADTYFKETRFYQENKYFTLFLCLERQTKVKRSVLINKIEKGELKMPDINSMISAQRINWIKKVSFLKFS